MKKWTLALLGATTAFALSSGAAMAYTATVYDPFQGVGQPAGTEYSHTFYGGTWYDASPSQTSDYSSGSIDVTWSGSNVTLTLHTNMPSQGAVYGSGVFAMADIFIDLGNDGTPNAPDWDYGIDISSGTLGFGETTTTQGGKKYVNQDALPTANGDAAKLVALTNASQIAYSTLGQMSATKICADGNGANSCGNDGDAGRRAEVEVIGEEGTDVGFNVATTGNGTNAPKYTISITLSAVNGLGNWDNLRVFWGTAWCSNDTVEGVAKIPVPAALPIIGAALAGFGFAGWRQRKAA